MLQSGTSTLQEAGVQPLSGRGSPVGEIVKKPVCWATGETPQTQDRGTMDGRNKQITIAC